MFHVPNVGMTLPLNLLFGLAYGGAEAVVDLLVDAIARFVPDEIRDRIDGSVEELVGLPEVGLELSIGLPFLEMESEQRIVKRRLPEIKEEARWLRRARRTFRRELPGRYRRRFYVVPLCCSQAAPPQGRSNEGG